MLCGVFKWGNTITVIWPGSIKFGVNNADTTNTCSIYGRHFQFDATTEGGKNMLSILLAASMAGKKINVWYTASSAPGTNNTNGCNDSSIAVLTQIGLH